MSFGLIGFLLLGCEGGLLILNYGFVNHGMSESQHGGVTWYNMVKLSESLT